MDDFIKLLDSSLECIDYKLKPEKQECIITARSNKINLTCPYGGTISHQVHSVYQREAQDLPLQGIRVILLLNTQRMFCKILIAAIQHLPKNSERVKGGVTS